MLQQRKKDYLQRLIEEFFKKLHLLIDQAADTTDQEKRDLLDNCFDFFTSHMQVLRHDSANQIVDKVNENDLLEQYAKLLLIEFDLSDKQDNQELSKALEIVDYLQKTDTTYSWERVVLREDILRKLDEASNG